MTIRVRELNDDEFDLVLEDAQVANVGLAVQLNIYIQDAIRDTLKIAISTPFRAGESEDALDGPIDPEKDDPRIGEVIVRLRRKILTQCHIDQDGTLKLRFDDGFVILVGPDQKYEAWDLDHARFKIVGAAGGELAIWNR